MIIRQGYRYRLKTTPATAHALRVQAGHCRFAWNQALALSLARLEQSVPLMRYADLCGLVKLWKATDERGFLREAYSQALQQTMKDLDRAFRDAFDPSQPNKKLPRFKKRGLRDSFRYPQGFKLDRRRVYLPKIGCIGYFDSRPIEGQPKNVTVSFDNGHWYISIQTEQVVEEPEHPSTTVEGIDLGVAAFAATARGELIEPINAGRKYQAKLTRLQRKLARQQRFSANWQKTKVKIRNLHHKIDCIRADFLHKTSTALSKNHALIVVEDLQVKNMSASAKGAVDNPGRNVRQKAGLNRSILDQGWGEFRRQLAYKLEKWAGNWFGSIPPIPVSGVRVAGIRTRIIDPARLSSSVSSVIFRRMPTPTQPGTSCWRDWSKAGYPMRKPVVSWQHIQPGGIWVVKPVEGKDVSLPEAGTVGGRKAVNTTSPCGFARRNPRPSGRGGCQDQQAIAGWKLRPP